MRFYERFSYCPCCGEKYSERDFNSFEVLFTCGHCGDRFYQNPIPSCTTVIPSKSSPDAILLLTRATEPNQGKLALPGGILRYGEAPAKGAQREVKEETFLDVTIKRLLCETLVDYEYRGMHISVVELAFLAQPIDSDVHDVCSAEASCLGYYEVGELLQASSRLAFPEQRRVLEYYEKWMINSLA